MCGGKTRAELEAKIKMLEAENKRLKAATFPSDINLRTVTVPEHFQDIFKKAQNYVQDYFSNFSVSPENASITINDERYLLIRASGLSYGFLNKIQDLFLDKGEEYAYLIGKNLLFDLSHILGLDDAQVFHKKMNLKDPVEKLSTGPVHFAFAGWSFVDILPESNTDPNDFILKFHHHHSFEADAWIKKEKKSKFPVCIMNAGYSSGWCEQSFGIPLTTVEVTCRAMGDEHCTFIMAPPEKIEQYLKEYKHRQQQDKYDIPLFFERQKAQEEIKKSLLEKELLLKEVHHRVKNNLQIISSILNLQTKYSEDDRGLLESMGNRIKTMALVHEKFYQSTQYHYVLIQDYIASIVHLLTSQFETSGIAIHIFQKTNMEEKKTPIDQAISIGLIANELITNAIQHAFINKQNGNIYIDFKELESTLHLSIIDDGVGIPEDFVSQPSTTSLGWELIHALVEQIDGQLTIDSHQGTSITVSFPK